jgi:tripartite-type tricarboxylate transporter receptor subunit TctC
MQRFWSVVALVPLSTIVTAQGGRVIVENRAGAGGTIGSTAVMKSPADGYTLRADFEKWRTVAREASIVVE